VSSHTRLKLFTDVHWFAGFTPLTVTATPRARPLGTNTAVAVENASAAIVPVVVCVVVLGVTAVGYIEHIPSTVSNVDTILPLLSTAKVPTGSVVQL
jgi:hypothetical protein